jgi:hydroxyacylglutathione hydrolase
MPIRVTPIPCLSDNYAWLLVDDASGEVALCDPGEAGPALAALPGGRCDWVLLTHHHGDHIAGVGEIVAQTGTRVAGAAADAHRLPKLDLALREGETGPMGSVVIDTPGHTRGHIAFHVPAAQAVLCGDTLFALGCGRLLEGSAEEMFASLAKLAALPVETLVCCGHEYTESNARFALTVEPDNAALVAQAEAVHAARAAGRPTVPTTIAQERAANPFVRAPDVATLARIRAGKDVFR